MEWERVLEPQPGQEFLGKQRIAHEIGRVVDLAAQREQARSVSASQWSRVSPAGRRIR